MKVEMPGLGDSIYLGTGCFHRRESLCGRKYSEHCRMLRDMWNQVKMRKPEESTSFLEERAKDLASCTYEQNTNWGKDVISPSLSLPLSLIHTNTVMVMVSHLADWYQVWVLGGGCGNWLVNPNERMEIDLLQSFKERLLRHISYYTVTAIGATQAMVWRALPNVPLEILSFSLWLWKDRVKASDVLCYIHVMGSYVVANSILCYHPFPLPSQRHSFVPKSKYSFPLSLV